MYCCCDVDCIFRLNALIPDKHLRRLSKFSGDIMDPNVTALEKSPDNKRLLIR